MDRCRGWIAGNGPALVGVIAAAFAAAFAIKALLLIDATGLWSDELYSVGKSFQPSFPALLAMLRDDTHPPLYYVLLWLWGGATAQSALSLRLLSWLAYLLGGGVMVAQARALAPPRKATVAGAVAALLAFCSPYPVRFAIEGKSYALLVALVALGWWWRRRWLEGRSAAWGYGLAVAAAALTHFYGLFLFAAAAVWDGWRRRWPLAGTAALGLLPALGWIAYASAYLFSSRSGSWIGRPDFALLEDTLARALGPWPLPKLALLLLVLLVVRRWGLERPATEQGRLTDAEAPRWLPLPDSSGLIASALMVLGVVLLSFVKPLAFSRYFVVLLPALLPWLAVVSAGLPLNRLGRALALALIALMLGLWWQQAYAGIDGSRDGSREADQFLAISQLTAAEPERYGSRPRLLNLSDRMALAAGTIAQAPQPWQDQRALARRLHQPPLPATIVLAASGPEPDLRRRLKPLRRLAEAAGYSCAALEPEPAFSRVLRCRWPAMAPRLAPPGLQLPAPD